METTPVQDQVRDHVSPNQPRDLAQDSLNRTPQALRMRCPTCRKLYSTDLQSLSEAPQPPRFDCMACHTRFAVSMPIGPMALSAETYVFESQAPASTPAPAQEKVQEPQRFELEPSPAFDNPISQPRLPLDWSEPAAARTPEVSVSINETRDCPKCGTSNPKTTEECVRCGVVFARYKPQEDERLAGDFHLLGRRELANLWNEVMENYADDVVHDKFIAACYDVEALPFAAHKYARILSASPGEETAKRMRKRIVGLASQKAESRGANVSWNFRIPSLNSMAIFLGAIITTLGMMFPNMKNLTGIGISLLACAIGMRFFLRRSE